MLQIQDKTTIILTRGDDAYISIPVVKRVYPSVCNTKYVLKRYLLSEDEKVEICVRTEPVVDDKTQCSKNIVFYGAVDIQEGIPIWQIQSQQSDINTGTYYWDMQYISQTGLRQTLTSGLLKIVEEVTL